jgi:hypothetical protein
VAESFELENSHNPEASSNQSPSRINMQLVTATLSVLLLLVASVKGNNEPSGGEAGSAMPSPSEAGSAMPSPSPTTPAPTAAPSGPFIMLSTAELEAAVTNEQDRASLLLIVAPVARSSCTNSWMR